MKKKFLCLIILGGTLFCGHPVAQQQADPRVDAFKKAYAEYQSLANAGNFPAAAPRAHEALELGLELFGESHTNTAALTYNYGDALLRIGHKDDARSILNIALERYEAAYGKDSEELIPVLMDLGQAGLNTRKGTSNKSFRRALKLIEKYEGKESDAYADACIEAGAALMIGHEHRTAKKYLDEGYQILEAAHGVDHTSTGRASFHLGKYWLSAKDYPKARGYFLQALGTFENPEEPSTQFEMSTHAFLVSVYENLDQSDDATEHCLAIGRMSPAAPTQDYQPLFRAAPTYPTAAISKYKEGYVDLRYTVDENGFVRDPVVVDSVGRYFDNPAIEAIEKWRYAPRFVENQAVATEGVEVRLTFKYSD